MGQLQAEYRDHGAIDYDDPERLIAYTLHFAPKHALIWRALARRFTWTESQDDVWLLNSIGPGPGSDIIGMLCGLPAVESMSVDVVGLESAEEWRLLFEIAREEFVARTGINFNAVMTKDAQHLHRKGQTVGSFVLSDAARGGTLQSLLQSIGANVDAAEAWFLDFKAFTHETDGPTFVNKAVVQAGFHCTFKQLAELKLDLANTISAQMGACNPLYCRRGITEEPNANFMTVRLR